ncbi:MAG: hypothetical protein NTU83_13690, partial [Candidatus Hydrogenedentes bacterium]|nr:hypothetical protein [Candidatus Hydrogenedentota bacterium]
AAVVKDAFPHGVGETPDPPLGFVKQLASPCHEQALPASEFKLTPRYCFSYFGLTGDPFLARSEDIYPDGYLARLAARGVDGIWLQGVLFTLAPFPWDPERSARYEERLENLRTLVERAGKHGIGVYLYLNEPRAMPNAFFAKHPELKGVTEGDYSTLCTSHPDVQKFIRDSIASICKAVPNLRGLFSITASENMTNCYSHYQGKQCPRCKDRTPAQVISEVIRLYYEGVQQAGAKTEVIAWDWGWQDEWALEAIDGLPKGAAFMSVSEWSIPIERGGVKTTIGEYSMSVIGPGPRAQKHWAHARERGLKTIAKIQAGTTWECGGVPYLPVTENVAKHIANLRDAKLDGLMLGWTLGGYPSPNLEVVAEMTRVVDGKPAPTPDEAMHKVAERWFGGSLGEAVVAAWKAWSVAFQEFPFAGGLVYAAPVHTGPSNLLWEAPTHYVATMVGFPYDDVDTWRAIYPVDVFTGQLEKIADGFDKGIDALRGKTKGLGVVGEQYAAFEREAGVATAVSLHYRSAADQARFVMARRALEKATAPDAAKPLIDELERLVKSEMDLAKRLYALQANDSRLGFEASNQYFYVPVDLAEKVLNCRDLLDRWLPEQRKRVGL